MSVPDDVRERIREQLWKIADEIDWNHLSVADKRRYYRNWTNDQHVGGVLSRYMEVGAVRTYIKDAVMKVYSRRRQGDLRSPLTRLGIDPAVETVKTYEKPHGVRLADGRVICWGPAKGWKVVLMALHERSFEDSGSHPYGAVLFNATAGFGDVSSRVVVENAATKLGIRKLIWV
jgi:hypothetical protein